MNHYDAKGAPAPMDWDLVNGDWWQREPDPRTVPMPAVGINDSWISTVLACQLPDRAL